MAEVKRYDIGWSEMRGCDVMGQYASGEYVLYSDYAALERRLRIAAEALRYEFWSRHPVYAVDMLVELALKNAETNIDSEQKEQL